MCKTNSEGFRYLKEKFPNVSAAKLKEGILIGPQIRELIKDNNFVCHLNTAEQEAWQAFIWTCENFLGNYKALTYKDGIQNLLNAYNKLGCRMSLKIHFFAFTLRFFSGKLRCVGCIVIVYTFCYVSSITPLCREENVLFLIAILFNLPN
ncbi:hypothetical protein QTP88_021325 [Uroleucon formosanum]